MRTGHKRYLRLAAKRALLGDTARPFLIRAGLLKGLTFIINPLNQSQRILGLSEREIAPAIGQFSKHCRAAVDVGASDGWYTVYFASRANIERVFACEPDLGALEALRQNLVLNASRIAPDKVSIVPHRIAGYEGAGAVTLDALLESAPEPIVAKIDVDGFELHCLQGFAHCLRTKDVMLVVETHSAELEANCIDFCQGLGYGCEVIHNAWYRYFLPEMRPIPHNRWFIAEKRRRML